MLGWRKNRTTASSETRPARPEEENRHTDDRLGRLLGRLGSDAGAAQVDHEPPSQVTPFAAEEPPPPAPAAKPEYVAGVDPDDYREALPLLRQVVIAVGGSPEDDALTLTNKIVDALRDRHGFTPDLLADIAPYLDQFIRDVQAGTVQIGTAGQAVASENEPAAPAAEDVA